MSVALGLIAIAGVAKAAQKQKLSKEERDAILAKAFETKEGRMMLVQAMVQPIRCGGWEYCQNDGALIKNRRKPCPKCGRIMDKC